MILTTAAFLGAAGFGIWILGSVFGYHEIATIGAIIVFGLGLMVTDGGLEIKSGEVEEEIDNGSQVQTDYVYSDVDLPTSLSLGALLMVAGGVLLLRSLNELGDS